MSALVVCAINFTNFIYGQPRATSKGAMAFPLSIPPLKGEYYDRPFKHDNKLR